MSNTEMNRQIVQEGLDRKQTARKQRMTDAAHDAAERQLRATINQRTQERRAAIEAAEAEERRQAEREEAIRRQRADAKAQEKKDVGQTIHFMYRIFGILLYASVMTICYLHESISAGVAFATVGLAVIYCVAVFVNHTVRLNRERRVA